MGQFERCELLYGDHYLTKLANKHIAVFGVGGVGGAALESLVRTGIPEISIFDFDTIAESNINRQLIADHNHLNELKVDAFEKRLLSINPDLIIHKYPIFVGKETIEKIDFDNFTYIVDAMDNVTAKLLVIEKAKSLNIPIVSSMGTGNKNDSSMLKIMDVYQTNYCPLAKIMRKELRARNIKKLTVMSSTQQPIKHEKNKETVASSMFVPAIAGLKISEYIINDLLKEKF